MSLNRLVEDMVVLCREGATEAVTIFEQTAEESKDSDTIVAFAFSNGTIRVRRYCEPEILKEHIELGFKVVALALRNKIFHLSGNASEFYRMELESEFPWMAEILRLSN